LIAAFGHSDLEVFTDEKLLRDRISESKYEDYNVLLMTSGNFNKMEMDFS
jgi:UDP-N-acetylmuramate: L-alanyl-gamma-D-glutamyl-meso-diaminopimelate ligase